MFTFNFPRGLNGNASYQFWGTDTTRKPLKLLEEVLEFIRLPFKDTEIREYIFLFIYLTPKKLHLTHSDNYS